MPKNSDGFWYPAETPYVNEYGELVLGQCNHGDSISTISLPSWFAKHGACFPVNQPYKNQSGHQVLAQCYCNKLMFDILLQRKGGDVFVKLNNTNLDTGQDLTMASGPVITIDTGAVVRDEECKEQGR
jgi:hypothetical protein